MDFHPLQAKRLLASFLPLIVSLLLGTVDAHGQKLDMEKLKGIRARSIGPAGMSGRVTSIDVVLKNPQIIYAAMWDARLGPWEDKNSYEGTHGGLFKSTDGGNTWKQLIDGLPKDLVQINIAIAASNPSRIYATLSTKEEGAYASSKGLGVYRSDDAGMSWRKITDDPRPAMKIGGGDLPVPRVDPQNPDVVYTTSIVTCKSTDGGKTWISLRGAPGGENRFGAGRTPHSVSGIAIRARPVFGQRTIANGCRRSGRLGVLPPHIATSARRHGATWAAGAGVLFPFRQIQVSAGVPSQSVCAPRRRDQSA